MPVAIAARKPGMPKTKTFPIATIAPWPTAQNVNTNKEDFLMAKKTVSATFAKFAIGNSIYVNF